MLSEVALEVEKGFDVGVHALALRIGHEHDSVNSLQDELAACVVENLAGDGVEVKSSLESADGAQVQRQKIKEKSAVGFRGKADQLALCLGRSRVIYILKIGSLAAQARPVIDDF